MKKRQHYRPRRPQNNKESRHAAGGVFAPARETVMTILDGVTETLATECMPGYPLVDASARRCTLELSRDWSWTARLADDGATPYVGLSATLGEGDDPERRVPMDDGLGDQVEASVDTFIGRFRAR